MNPPKAVYGSSNPKPEELATTSPQRFGSVIELRPEQEQYYRELHANAWPEVLDRLRKSNIRNFSIFQHELEGKKFLFSYFEYTGNDLDQDMRAIGEDPATQRWWKETDPCQRRLPTAKEGENWSPMEMLFHID